MNPSDREELLKYLVKVEEAQKRLDDKTRQSAVYRDYNIKLFQLIKIGIIGFICFLIISICAISLATYSITNRYFNYEQGICRTQTMETDNVCSDGRSIVINRSDGVDINGK